MSRKSTSIAKIPSSKITSGILILIIASQSSGKFVETRDFQNEAEEERNQLEKVWERARGEEKGFQGTNQAAPFILRAIRWSTENHDWG
jgi:hypothetical protein